MLAAIKNWELGIADFFQEGVAFGETLDAGREVGIGLAVAGNAASEPGDDAACVEVVEGLDDGAVGGGKFEYNQLSSRLQHTQHLVEALFQMDEVADAEGAGDGVEGGVGEREMLRVGNHESHHWGLLPGNGQHLLADIHSRYCAASFD